MLYLGFALLSVLWLIVCCSRVVRGCVLMALLSAVRVDDFGCSGYSLLVQLLYVADCLVCYMVACTFVAVVCLLAYG